MSSTPALADGLRIGSLFGIEIRIHSSWLVIFTLILFHVSAGVFPALRPNLDSPIYWILGFGVTLAFFASLLLHELAHSLVARSRGISVKSITLFLLGGIANLDRRPQRPGAEFLIASAGPATSAALGAGFLLLTALLAPDISLEAETKSALARLSPLALGSLWIGSVNLLIGAFNLVPAYPLDGGRIFHAATWALLGDLKKATFVASMLGQAFALLLIGSGIAMMLGFRVPLVGSGLVGGIWLMLLGWFLHIAARSEYEALKREKETD